MTKHLAIAELSIRIARHQQHARNALAALGRAKTGDRVRRQGHGVERTMARECCRAKRHMRNAAEAKALLTAMVAS